MKKIVIITIALLLVAVSTSALTGNNPLEWFGTAEATPVKIVDKKFITDEGNIQEFLIENDITPDIIYELIIFYAENMLSEEAQKYLNGLARQGYDVDLLKRAALFWLDTDDGIEIVKEILDNLGVIDPEATPMQRNDFIEQSYDNLTDNQNGLITLDQCRDYGGKGISVEELWLARDLSRKGIFDIHAILNKTIEDGGMYKTIKEIYSKTKREKYDFSGVSDEMLMETPSYEELLSGIRLSNIEGKSVSEILSDKTNSAQNEMTLKREQNVQKVEAMLSEKGIGKPEKMKKSFEVIERGESA